MKTLKNLIGSKPYEGVAFIQDKNSLEGKNNFGEVYFGVLDYGAETSAKFFYKNGEKVGRIIFSSNRAEMTTENPLGISAIFEEKEEFELGTDIYLRGRKKLKDYGFF